MSRHVKALSDADTVANHVAEWMTDLAQKKAGRVSIALSGGATPRTLYLKLASTYADRFPWQRTHWFWGDERYVPHDDERSNLRMVRETLFAHGGVPPENIHPVPTHFADPVDAAEAYEAELKDYYGADQLQLARPLFDIILLGLGTDGHTASLFPNDPTLGERHAWTRVVTAGQPERRITLTYPALESVSAAAFLVTGAEKRPMVERLLQGDWTIPAGRLNPTNGSVFIFTDQSVI